MKEPFPVVRAFGGLSSDSQQGYLICEKSLSCEKGGSFLIDERGKIDHVDVR